MTDPLEAAFTLRPATADDVVAIQALLRDTWHAAYDGIFGADAVDLKCDLYFSDVALLHFVHQSPRDWFAVAVTPQGRTAGIALVRMTLLGNASINLLYVHPDFQGRGVGTHLIGTIPHVFPWARSMTLEALEPNAPALAFYEQRGFERRGVRKDRQGLDVPVVLMTRALPRETPWWEAVLGFVRQGWDKPAFAIAHGGAGLVALPAGEGLARGP